MSTDRRHIERLQHEIRKLTERLCQITDAAESNEIDIFNFFYLDIKEIRRDFESTHSDLIGSLFEEDVDVSEELTQAYQFRNLVGKAIKYNHNLNPPTVRENILTKLPPQALREIVECYRGQLQILLEQVEKMVDEYETVSRHKLLISYHVVEQIQSQYVKIFNDLMLILRREEINDMLDQAHGKKFRNLWTKLQEHYQINLTEESFSQEKFQIKVCEAVFETVNFEKASITTFNSLCDDVDLRSHNNVDHGEITSSISEENIDPIMLNEHQEDEIIAFMPSIFDFVPDMNIFGQEANDDLMPTVNEFVCSIASCVKTTEIADDLSASITVNDTFPNDSYIDAYRFDVVKPLRAVKSKRIRNPRKRHNVRVPCSQHCFDVFGKFYVDTEFQIDTSRIDVLNLTSFFRSRRELIRNCQVQYKCHRAIVRGSQRRSKVSRQFKRRPNDHTDVRVSRKLNLNSFSKTYRRVFIAGGPRPRYITKLCDHCDESLPQRLGFAKRKYIHTDVWNINYVFKDYRNNKGKAYRSNACGPSVRRYSSIINT